jgi:hypothetical protein
MIERPGEQIHQQPHDFLARLWITTHYRYFTAFSGSV